jgi:hypothetical protein
MRDVPLAPSQFFFYGVAAFALSRGIWRSSGERFAVSAA